MKESALFRLDGPAFTGRAESAASGQKCIAPSWNNGVFLVKNKGGRYEIPTAVAGKREKKHGDESQ